VFYRVNFIAMGFVQLLRSTNSWQTFLERPKFAADLREGEGKGKEDVQAQEQLTYVEKSPLFEHDWTFSSFNGRQRQGSFHFLSH